MVKISIVPELLNNRGIEITDENNIPVKICEESKFTLTFGYFKNPFILIDNLEIGKYENIEIKRINFSDLERFNLRLVAIDLRSASRRNMRNRQGQQVCYTIKRKNDSLEGARELFKFPKDHLLEMDITNKRVRIRGNNSFPYLRNENSSKWFNIEYGR